MTLIAINTIQGLLHMLSGTILVAWGIYALRENKKTIKRLEKEGKELDEYGKRMGFTDKDGNIID